MAEVANIVPVRRPFIVERRRIAGLTQEALAAAVGVQRSTVARWETGATEPMLWVRPRLAATLGLTLEELHGMLEEPGIGVS